MLLLFLALTFLSSLLVPISSPLCPALGGHLSASHPVRRERRLPPLPAGQRPGQAGERCLHPASISAAARTTVAVEKSS